MLPHAYDEIHQTFIPSRTGRWQDVVLDTLRRGRHSEFVIYLRVVLRAVIRQKRTAVTPGRTELDTVSCWVGGSY